MTIPTKSNHVPLPGGSVFGAVSGPVSGGRFRGFGETPWAYFGILFGQLVFPNSCHSCQNVQIGRARMPQGFPGFAGDTTVLLLLLPKTGLSVGSEKAGLAVGDFLLLRLLELRQ